MTAGKIIIRERFQKALDESSISRLEVCSGAGISNGTLSRYLTGSMSPRPQVVRKMAAVLNVNPAWLTGACDSMDVVNDSAKYIDTPASVAGLLSLTQTEQGLIEMFRGLSFKSQLKVMTLTNDLFENEVNK